jgi:hypothetical protein
MTRLGDKIPIEPLGEPRVRRIENAVLAALESSIPAPRARGIRPGRLAAALAVCAAAALVLGFLVGRSGERPLGPGPVTAMETPVWLETGDDRVSLALDGSTVEVGPRTRVAILRDGGAVTLALAGGAVDCDVEPREGRPRFEVVAGEVRIEVVGTAFRVERDGVEVKVSVTRGRVRVDSAAGDREVVAGEGWSVSGGMVALAAADPDAPERSAGLGRRGNPDMAAGDEDRDRVRAMDRDRDGDRGRAGEPDPGPGRNGDRDRAGAGAATGAASGARRTPGGDSSAGGGDRMSCAEALRRLHLPPPVRPRNLSDNDRAAFDAVEGRQEHDARKAAEWYREIARRRTGEVAAFALYSYAWLKLEKLRDPDQALVAADEYLRRFPQGRQADAALVLRLRIACRGHREDCQAAAAEYLERFPAGGHARAATALAD